jgi:RHS repeat-associated protein
VSGGQTYPNNNFTLSSNTIPTTGAIKKVYYSAGAQLIAMRIITDGGSVLYYLHSDHLGSTSLTTNSSGGFVARQLYDAWGNVRSGGGLPTDISYTGQRSDATGLMYFKARYYDSAVGRFVSADTIVPDGQNPQAFNRYAYGLNNPIKYRDPSGHDPSCAAFGPYAGICEAASQLLEKVVVPVAELVVAGVGGAAIAAAASDITTAVGTVAAAPIEWALQDNGPDYPLPAQYVAGAAQATYPLPGTTTLMAKQQPVHPTTIKFDSPNPNSPPNLSRACRSAPLICLGIIGGGVGTLAYLRVTIEDPQGPQIPTLPTSTPTKAMAPTPTQTRVPLPTGVPAYWPPISPIPTPYPSVPQSYRRYGGFSED